ncbi:hypothetical protein W97_00776 [Coniosporium apollinis CBS 100218]|uniref:YebC-like protein n=1 Tax=Coniosporium apollinis (strain CBS 100218) TaxID=1168221 RepID=R7YIW4_CONA1|nr:uncharacterized protein W97_00776 [Coniosporium apollinis CBS 100218]EON61561.1 hypothetical protein W97_00776 [Coniosporium apollinis CBS 100218]
MFAPSTRLLRSLLPADNYVCQLCRKPRAFSTRTSLQSGHSKWATIKHDKGKNDAAKNKQRSVFSHEIANASKFYGPDPNTNARLALAISLAKKAGVPKANIESAIARGQGVSASGAALEPVTVEAIFPPSVAVVIDCLTDNKLRILADIRHLIKQHQGSVTPTNYLFEKKGQIIFKPKEGLGADEVLDTALEAAPGVLDVVEGADGRVVVFTEPADTKGTGETLSGALGLEVEESEIIWDPNEDTKVEISDEEAAQALSGFAEKLQDISGVQAMYMNASQGNISDATWADLQSRLAV